MDRGTSLVKLILSNGGADIVGDVSELALDAALDEGLLKEIPVFGWFAKGYGVVTAMRDRIFLKKIALFLKGVSVKGQSPEKFQEELSNPEFCKKVGETLILLLDRQDNFDKAQFLGKVFNGYLRGEFDYDMFLRLASAIDRALITDLKNLPSYYQKMKSYLDAPKSTEGPRFAQFMDGEASGPLCNAGLASNINPVTEEICVPNEVGSRLIKLLFEQDKG